MAPHPQSKNVTPNAAKNTKAKALMSILKRNVALHVIRQQIKETAANARLMM
jgi:hypothetical protein